MKCLPETRYIPWEQAAKIMSTPLLVEKHGYKTDIPNCIEWILGEYRIKGTCDDPNKILKTEQPSTPTFTCDFTLFNPEQGSWVVDLAIHESILQPYQDFTTWVNTAPYFSVGDFKLARKEFPGSVCGEDGYCYGEPFIKPLFARSINLRGQTEKTSAGPPRTSNVIPMNTDSWRGAKGFYRTMNNSWSYYYDSKRSLGLLVFNDSLGEAKFWLGVYRPKATILHPYLFVESRLDDGVYTASPLISLKSPDGRYFTLASLSTLEAVLDNGILTVRPSSESGIIIVSESPPLSSLKQLYNTVSPLVEAADYRVRGGNTQIASLRLGCGLLGGITFSEGWLKAIVYNPGNQSCVGEVKLQGVIEEAYQDDDTIEPLFDRVKVVFAPQYYGSIKVKVKRSISLILRLSGS